MTQEHVHRPRGWLIILFVLLLAAGVRLLTFQRTLPFVDYPDEANMFLLAVDGRGDFPLAEAYGAHLTGERLAGYPPLYPWLAGGVQRVVESVSTKAYLFSGDYVYALRLLAVAAGVLTTALMMLAGYTLGGLLAAMPAGLVWALSPVVVEWNSLAIPDPLVYLASAAALAFALWAWHRDAPAWTLPSLLAVVAAIYLKYVPVHTLVAWGLVMLVLLRRDWRRTLPWLILELVIGAASALWLIFGYGALSLHNDEAMRLDVGMALDIERGLRNLEGAVLPISTGLFVLVLIFMVYGYAFRSQREYMFADRDNFDWRKALYLLAVTVVGILSVSTFIGAEPYSNQMRHVLPVSVAVIGLWSMLVADLVSTARYLGGRTGAGIFLVLIVGLFMLSALAGDAALAQRFSQPDPRYELWQWSDASLPPDGKIMMFSDSPLRSVWNRPYSGYDGQTAFEWVFDDAPYLSTPRDFYAQGVAYMAEVASDGWNDHLSEMSVFADGPGGTLMPLKIFPAQDQANTIYFYRMVPPQHAAEATFGDQIALIGYDLDVSTDTIRFRPYWQAQITPPVDYSMFVHLTTADSLEPLAQYDGSPAQPRRPATSWDDPAERLIGADAVIDLPGDLPAGEYRLRVGLYSYTSGQRLPLDDGADALIIPVEIGSSS